MIRPGLQIRGITASIVALDKMKEMDSIKIQTGMVLSGNLIYMESQKLVPKDTLALQKSGRRKVEGRGFFCQVTVDYGGETAPYAWVVHYDPTKYHAPPTQDHYLSDAVRNTKGACQILMNRSMRGWLYKGNSESLFSRDPQQEL